jgi:site-specific DNA-cytosine methylase
VRDALPELLQIATRNDFYVDASTAVSPAVLASDGKRTTSTQVGAALGMGEFKIECANGFNGHAYQSADGPAGLDRAGRPVSIEHGAIRRKFTIAEVKRICAFPDDFILTGSYAQQWERLGNSVPPVMMRHIAEAIRDKVLT